MRGVLLLRPYRSGRALDLGVHAAAALAAIPGVLVGGGGRHLDHESLFERVVALKLVEADGIRKIFGTEW